MARLSLVLFICCLFIGVFVNSHILKSEATRVPSDDESLQDDLPMEMSAFPENGDNPIEIQSLDRINDDKECARVGEFCMYHWDCCSHSCLGYMKRCVSG